MNIFNTSFTVFLLASGLGVSHSAAQSLSVLVNFHGANGATPNGSLVAARDGNYYGTTYSGGVNDYGTIFRLSPAGAFTVVHNFGSSNGGYPLAGVIQGSDGNLYGTTSGGNIPGNSGTIFKLSLSGEFTTIHALNPDSDGAYPEGGLVQAADGNFYGAAAKGGRYGFGTVFKLTLSGGFSVLYSFDGSKAAGPDATLIQASDGNLYGVTAGVAWGTIFRLTLAGDLMLLHAFDESDGADPLAPLVQAPDGNLYGTTTSGGSGDGGVAFRITLAGSFQPIYTFHDWLGEIPEGALVVGTDGELYGSTSAGGQNFLFLGTIFKMTTHGQLTTLHTFHGVDGQQPTGALLFINSNTLLGTAQNGGKAGVGTVYLLALAN